MEIFTIWIICGVISAVVASNKGRSGCGWFVIGVLLGPLGLIWAAVTPSNDAKVERRAIQGGGYRNCPYCAESIRSSEVSVLRL